MAKKIETKYLFKWALDGKVNISIKIENIKTKERKKVVNSTIVGLRWNNWQPRR